MLAQGQRRMSCYLTQHELECLNKLAREFKWARGTVVGAAIRAVWKQHVNANKGNPPR